MLDLLTLTIFGALEHSAEDVNLKGQLLFAPGTKPGEVYLVVKAGSEGGLVVPKVVDTPTGGKREAPPEGNPGFSGHVPIGSLSSENFNFSVGLPEGSYVVSAFVKNGSGDGPKCVTKTISGRQVAFSCFPTKNDTVCGSESVNLEKNPVVEINCGREKHPPDVKP